MCLPIRWCVYLSPTYFEYKYLPASSLSVCLSVGQYFRILLSYLFCLSVCIRVSLSVSLSIRPSIFFALFPLSSVCLSTCLYLCLSVFLPVCLPIHGSRFCPSLHLPAYPSARTYVSPCLLTCQPPVCLSVGKYSALLSCLCFSLSVDSPPGRAASCLSIRQSHFTSFSPYLSAYPPVRISALTASSVVGVFI